MTSTAVRANFFDASALVKLYVQEAGSDIVRPYFAGQPTKYTTPFCYYEALSVLKVKWLYREEIAKEQYLDAALRLTAWFHSTSRRIKDIDFTEPTTFHDARGLVDKTSLDLSDAFQILTIKNGFFSPLCGDSQTVLVTGDRRLATAARSEGLRVWSLMEEPAP
jgi:predicted nucleic acid-binding protein